MPKLQSRIHRRYIREANDVAQSPQPSYTRVQFVNALLLLNEGHSHHAVFLGTSWDHNLQILIKRFQTSNSDYKLIRKRVDEIVAHGRSKAVFSSTSIQLDYLTVRG